MNRAHRFDLLAFPYLSSTYDRDIEFGPHSLKYLGIIPCVTAVTTAYTIPNSYINGMQTFMHLYKWTWVDRK